MSTDYQKYSIENQAIAIGAYAETRNLSIVRTYRDDGQSGLKLKNRDGLRQLLDDVQSDRADFDQILVYDISRWGRFPDIDESAHYEFICKQAGIKVEYCAEQFENDGSMLSSIAKNLKRVMAAEYSRELSTKVHTGQCRVTKLGFKHGGRVGYALQRELVDENSEPRAILKNGERKYLITDHVRVRPGSPDEVAVIRWIFKEFEWQKSETAIARELNRRSILNSVGAQWNGMAVSRLLKNENYIGNLLFNQRSQKLRGACVSNSPDLWIRSEGCLEPIIDRDTFLRVRKVIDQRRLRLPEAEMLTRLRRTLVEKGCLSVRIINSTAGLPRTGTYRRHFGNLRNVYRLIGYTSKQNRDFLDFRRVWSDVLAEVASQVATGIRKVAKRAALAGSTDFLRVNSKIGISFRIAQWHRGKKENHSPHWAIQRRRHLAIGWIVAIRLGQDHRTVLDYVLLPTSSVHGQIKWFSENAGARQGVRRFKTPDALIRSISKQLAKTSRTVSAKQRRPKRLRKRSQSKGKIGRARH